MISVEPKLVISESKVSFSSTISSEQKGALERIFYFNENQSEYYSDIVTLIETYSQPRIVEENDRLCLSFEDIDCQNFFATVDNNLAGLATFYRNSLDNIDIIHIAVDESYSSAGAFSEKLLVLKMINELKKIALKIKGVKTITVKYGYDWIINLKSTREN